VREEKLWTTLASITQNEKEKKTTTAKKEERVKGRVGE
jgi:hypothetical protein